MNDKEIEALAKRISKLPPEIKSAYAWLIDNIETADRIAGNSIMTEKEVDEVINWALARKDYAMLMLALYKQIKEKNMANN